MFLLAILIRRYQISILKTAFCHELGLFTSSLYNTFLPKALKIPKKENTEVQRATKRPTPQYFIRPSSEILPNRSTCFEKIGEDEVPNHCPSAYFVSSGAVSTSGDSRLEFSFAFSLRHTAYNWDKSTVIVFKTKFTLFILRRKSQ